MKSSQLAVQLYTLRDTCQTAEDFAATCRKVRHIGYESIQLSGEGPIPDDEIARIISGEGLTCCATHEPPTTIREEPAKVADRLHRLGVKFTAYPYPHGITWEHMEEVDSLIADLDAAGSKLREAGLVLTYHNHANEFVRLANGSVALDYIYQRTDPRNLLAELDTYWVQAGGGDPAAWCEKMAGRLPLLHLKDYAVAGNGQPFFAEIGHGNLDWPRIISAAAAAGCEHFIVEQDSCPGDPFDSIRKSFEYLSANFFQ